MGVKQFVKSPAVMIVLIVGLLFVALALLGSKTMRERFQESADAALLPGDKLQVFLGSQMPDKEPNVPIKFDQNDPSAPSVDGTPGGPKSLYMMTYNKVSPACCDMSPYSTEGGCVCLTKEQMKFAGSRGKNSATCAL